MNLGKSIFVVSVLVPVLLVLALFTFLSGSILGAFMAYSSRLPEIPELDRYQPKTVSTIYADDGSVIGVFCTERRYVVQLPQIPPHVVNAFVAAEDSRFYHHRGVDFVGLARAAYRNMATGKIQQGASTITQQVTRLLLLSRDRKISRKIKEIILAMRLEKIWGKQKILYVYLNEIYLGDGCYGVEAAARNYFGKHVEQLTLGEAAILAGIVPNPRRYNPFRNKALSLKKKAFVLRNMLECAFITKQEQQMALREKTVFRTKEARPFDIVPDFTEAVRRYVVERYGEARLYNDGLKVFTTCRIEDQRKARKALQKGLREVKTRQRHLAVLHTLTRAKFPDFLKHRKLLSLRPEQRYQGLLTRVDRSTNGTRLHVALTNQVKGTIELKKRTPDYKVGEVLALRFKGFHGKRPFFELDDDPLLQGALICIENRTGYIRTLVGGASQHHFGFNRGIQAKRQPGSAFKPIVYAAALENFGYTPATVIVDEPVVIELEKTDEEWSPSNAEGNNLGPISLRRALELSRNICAVKVMMDVGIGPVVDMAKRMGVTSRLRRNLSLCLGTSEMSLLELTSAYTVFPNRGRFLKPVLVKRIEDRYGNLLEDNTKIVRLADSQMPLPTSRQAQERSKEQVLAWWRLMMKKKAQEECPSPNDPAPVWPRERPNLQGASIAMAKEHTTREISGTCPPAPPREERPAMSPQTAYIMTSLLQGVVRAGTGAMLRKYVKRWDLCGKTGTTNHAVDAWFVGFNQRLTTGVWVGFDDGRTLGKKETGARAALPVWGYFMKEKLNNTKQKKYAVPKGIIRKTMFTITGGTEKGTIITKVTEPVYSPLSDQTLFSSPLDPPETLYAKLTPPIGPAPAGQNVQGFPVQAVYPPGNRLGPDRPSYPVAVPSRGISPPPREGLPSAQSKDVPQPVPRVPSNWKPLLHPPARGRTGVPEASQTRTPKAPLQRQ